ncbi:MAG: repressor LexA [Planctomycetes bacterium]|nr:repressor LexA [Planctomycetota bacterium]
MNLPPKQTCVLEFFADAEDRGLQPSRAEVAEALNYAFPSAVSKHVDALVRKGLMETDPATKRNARLTDIGWNALMRTPSSLGVPVIGAIAAGVPILASEQHDSYLKDILPSPGRFALRVRGDSMIDAGILDGDFAVIDSQLKVKNGDIGAVVVDGDATLKRVLYRSDHIILEPANDNYQPLTVDKKSGTCDVVGPLAFLYRQAN